MAEPKVWPGGWIRGSRIRSPIMACTCILDNQPLFLRNQYVGPHKLREWTIKEMKMRVQAGHIYLAEQRDG